MISGEIPNNRLDDSKIFDSLLIPVFVDRIIRKAMADDPQKRYSCALEMEAEIRRQQKKYGIEV